MAGPDFSEVTKRLIRERADNRCSNPECGVPTVAADSASQNGVIRIGEVAHIKAARQGKPRYDPSQTDDERSAPENGVLLCCNCHTKVDANSGAEFPVLMLLDWKVRHEAHVRERLGKLATPAHPNVDLLIQRMRDDLKDARELLAHLRSKKPGSGNSWVAELQHDKREIGVRVGIMQTELSKLESAGHNPDAIRLFGYARDYIHAMRSKYGI